MKSNATKPIKPAKNPIRKAVALVANCSEERILQLSNDLSEDMASGTIKEWRAVALYFRKCFDDQFQRTASLRNSLAAFHISEQMRASAKTEIFAWLKANRPD